jgi:hypothetical protein
MLDVEHLANGMPFASVGSLSFSTSTPRHAMLVDQKTDGVFVPLNTYLEADGNLELANS